MSRLAACALTGLGVVLCATPAAAGAADGGDSGAAVESRAVREPVGPPRPVVTAGGQRLTASLGTFCYRGECADFDDFPRTSRGLAVRRGSLVVVRFTVAVATARLNEVCDPRCAPYHSRFYARLVRRHRQGRVWVFRVPRTPQAPTDLVLGVGFRPAGDALFGFKLLPARRGLAGPARRPWGGCAGAPGPPLSCLRLG